MGVVEINGLKFGYDKNVVLENVNISIEKEILYVS